MEEWIKVIAPLIGIAGLWWNLTTSMATKAELTAVKTDLSADIAEVKADLGAEINEVKADVVSVRAELKSELKAAIGSVKSDMADLKADLKAENAELRADIREIRQRKAREITLTTIKEARKKLGNCKHQHGIHDDGHIPNYSDEYTVGNFGRTVRLIHCTGFASEDAARKDANRRQLEIAKAAQEVNRYLQCGVRDIPPAVAANP